MSHDHKSLYKLKANIINGEEVKLSTFEGNVLLIVNTASKCVFTPQYTDLENLYKRYKSRGFVVLGFPSNDFLHQEPCTNKEIAEYCKLSYGVTFPIFEKGNVKGKDIQPVYSYLTNSENKKLSGKLRWNFEKFLIGKDGKVEARFRSLTKPLSKKLTSEVERALNA